MGTTLNPYWIGHFLIAIHNHTNRERIIIRGAKVHDLKNVDVDIPLHPDLIFFYLEILIPNAEKGEYPFLYDGAGKHIFVPAYQIQKVNKISYPLQGLLDSRLLPDKISGAFADYQFIVQNILQAGERFARNQVKQLFH